MEPKELENIFRNSQIEIAKDGERFLIVTFNKFLANRINDALGGFYPARIIDEEEPVFKVSRT